MSDLLRRRALMNAQSSGKTMQLLAEYTVTEPVRAFSIPITEQMRSCGTLYVMMDITASATDYLYFGLNNSVAWYARRISWADNFAIVKANAKTIEDVAFAEKWVATTDTGSNLPVRVGQLTFVQLYMYQTSSQITAGTVKIYGEV